MMDKANQLGRAARLVYREAMRQAGGSLSLLARMAAVVAIAFACVQLINRAAPLFAFGGPGDTTAFVMGQFEMLARVSVKLMSVGTDVLAFLGLN